MMKGLFCSLFFLPLMLCAQWFPAKITFSDGSVRTGEISQMGARPLTLAPDGPVRTVFQRFDLKDILSISQEVSSASMRKPWMYKESGKDEKIYFDGEYPLIEFKTKVLPVNGKTVRGRIIAYAMRFRGKGPKKLFLNYQIKGTLKQKLPDIVYIDKIEFTGNRPQKAVHISGRISGFGKVQSVRALDRTRGVMHEAGVVKNNSFSFSPLLPGKYELTILTDTHVLTGFSGTDKIPAELQKNFKHADDFFADRRILLLEETRTLVYKRRSEFYDSEKILKNGGWLWHLEQWNWHRAENEWKLDSRNMLLRRKQQGTENRRKILSIKALSDCTGGNLTVMENTPAVDLGPAY